jgi:hypothetical protein
MPAERRLFQGTLDGGDQSAVTEKRSFCGGLVPAIDRSVLRVHARSCQGYMAGLTGIGEACCARFVTAGVRFGKSSEARSGIVIEEEVWSRKAASHIVMRLVFKIKIVDSICVFW